MKVIAASVVNPEDSGIICYMTKAEASLIYRMCGNILGSGPNREITSNMYNTLHGKVGGGCATPFKSNAFLTEI